MEAIDRMPDKALIFIHHYNDLDHFTPVIGRLSVEGMTVSVVLCPGLDQGDDFRLDYLRALPGVTLSRLVDYLEPGRQASWRRAVAGHRLFTRLVPLRSAEKHKDRKWFEIFAVHFDKAVCRRVMDAALDGFAGVVVFDWLHKGMVDFLGLAGHFRELCDERGVPLVSLPHGDSPHSSQMLRLDEVTYATADIYGTVSMFDTLVVPNEICAVRYRPHARRLEVLGSPRFNADWLELLARFAPSFEPGWEKKGPKVVFFLRNVGYPLFWDEVVRTVRLVRAVPGAQLVVKHHTRDWKFKRLAAMHPELAEQERPGLLVNCDADVHSCSLVQWADVVLDVGTSMAFQAVMQDKPVFSMEYLHPSRSVVSDYLPETMTLCRDQLLDGLMDCAEHGVEGFYDQANRDRFVAEMIHGGGGPDVLGNYARLLGGIQAEART